MSNKASFILKDILMNHLPRVKEGLEKGYVDENQILFMFDHAVRARILSEQPEPLDEAAIANKQDEAWLDEIAKQWMAVTGTPFSARDDIEANVASLFELIESRIREQTNEVAKFIYDVETMISSNHQTLSYPQSEYHRKALAKLKEIRGEK